MRTTPAPVMTSEEFRAHVDRNDLSVEEIATATRRSLRAIRAYYYGERKLPNDVAMAVIDIAPWPERLRAVLGQNEEPWWSATLERFATLAGSQIRRDRADMARAIGTFCQGCEPEGVCRTEDCPLRAFSPFVFRARRTA